VQTNQGRDLTDMRRPTSEPLGLEIASSLASLLEGNGWSLSQSIQYCERVLLETALHRTRGNQSQTARLLGITPRSVYNKVRRHHLNLRNLTASGPACVGPLPRYSGGAESFPEQLEAPPEAPFRLAPRRCITTSHERSRRLSDSDVSHDGESPSPRGTPLAWDGGKFGTTSLTETNWSTHGFEKPVGPFQDSRCLLA
jgi:hypothetical protein